MRLHLPTKLPGHQGNVSNILSVMKNSSPVASRAAFAWTAVLTVLLASFAFVTLLTYWKSETIKSNLQALQLENDSYQKLDTCISLLYSAENNSRFFVVTLDSVYLSSYSDQLRTVMGILTEFETERKTHETSLSSLLSSKSQKNAEFVNLRLMVDSLLSFSLNTPEPLTLAAGRSARKAAVTRKTAQTDTTQISTIKSKRKLVGRIMDAIRNSDTLAKSVSLTNSSMVVSHDSARASLALVPVKNYSLLEKARRKLSATEQQLLSINGRIFSNLQKSLRELKNGERHQIKTLRMSLLSATSSRLTEMSVLIWGGVLVVILLAALIIYNLGRLYKKDLTIVQYANLTSEATKRKGHFMAQISHEIRTPLNSIIGFSQLIDTQKLEGELQENVNAIKGASKILLTLVNEILDFSKFESGKITLHNRPFLPEPVLSDAISMLSVLANEKKIMITFRKTLDKGFALRGDDFRIKQIIINLLSNAIKFTPEKGNIMVSASFEKKNQGKGLFKISIKDSGIGIAKEHLGTIFEDFTQVDSLDSKSRQVGTGLGLAICKRIVDLYGGTIKADSAPGQGSEFVVCLPLELVESVPGIGIPGIAIPGIGIPGIGIPEIDNAITAAGVTQPAVAFTTVLKGKKVLIADDIKMNLLLVSRFMDKLGASYDLAGDGQKAFEMFSNNPYDLVITDIQMPVMDGIELTKLIRSYEKKDKAQTPVLGFTGSIGEDKLAYYARIGMNDVLAKPFDEDHFSDILKGLFHPTNRQDHQN
jgi:signal transduction histidine kinase/CheY-like chemotaxis protein